MLIFLAALKQIPGSLYESAMVDGAKQWTMFWKITLPMLTPTIFFNLILQIVNGFRVFTESYVITDGVLGQYIIICIISVQKSIYIL